MYANFTGYNIYFRGANGKYFYARDSVQILNHQKTITLSNVEVVIDNKVIDAIRVEQFEDGYYRVYTKNRNFITRKIRFDKNRYRKICQYYNELADRGVQISEENTPLYFLSRNFKKFYVNRDSCLFDYLNERYTNIVKKSHIILPFSFNQSQRAAIEKALENNISVIEGPPGTGKTQTILNLIANIVVNGYSCAVVSNNNSAIQNVYDKLDEEKLSFFVASLGSREHVDSFFSSLTGNELTTFLKGDFKPINEVIINRIDQLEIILKKVQDVENEVAKKRVQLFEIEKEFDHFKTSLMEGFQINPGLKSKEYLKLKIKLEAGKPFGIFTRFWIRIKFKTRITREDNMMLLDAVERLFYIARIHEIKKQLEEKEMFLNINKGPELKKEFQDLSRRVFTDMLHKRYENMDMNEFTSENYKSDFSSFIKRFPVILSTSHSLINNLSKNYLIDYLIIDEASQGDLLSSILSVSCAKNMIVVGDSKQLQQIEDEKLIPYSIELSKKYSVDKCFHYDSNSILRSVKTAIPDVPTTMLREHYRCSPDIIGFCNKMFYDNELIVMTNNDGIHLNVIKTVPGNHARRNPNGSGQYNQREIDEIAVLLRESSSKDVGVITPFRYQADLIHKNIHGTDIEADTVHKFQGRQKEEVILSFVVNSLEKSDVAIENRLYDFITNKELLNVAVSRGIRKVTIIVSDKVYHSSNNVIKDLIDYTEYLYGDSLTRESKIVSIFDMLYIEYRDVLTAKYQKNQRANYTELLMNKLISNVLKQYRGISYTAHTRVGKLITDLSGLDMEEKKYITHPWTHVDFLFYNNISKKPLFALEVDGIRHHEQNIVQSERDRIKNKAFSQCSISLYRFKTNESGEENRLISILNQYGY